VTKTSASTSWVCETALVRGDQSGDVQLREVSSSHGAGEGRGATQCGPFQTVVVRSGDMRDVIIGKPFT